MGKASLLLAVVAAVGSVTARRPAHASLYTAKMFEALNQPPVAPVADDSRATFSALTDSNKSWSVQPGLVDGAVAQLSFSNTLNTTGWGVLELWTNNDFADEVQAFGAGVVEGHVTADHIYTTYLNLLPICFRGLSAPPAPVQQFMDAQEAWANSQIAANPNDPFWRNVGYIFQQYAGLEKGYGMSSAPALPHWAFQMLNGVGDLFDIVPAVMKEMRVDYFAMDRAEAELAHAKRGMCSGLVKVTGNYSDLFMAHSSWFVFGNTNRIFKTYHFNMSDPSVAAQTVSFSSYPGFLESLDDFYIMSSGLGMVQTTNSVMDHSAYDGNVTPESLLAWQRVRTAAAMAHTGEEWFNTFRTHFSGTYANQYMVVDFKLFTPNKPLPNNVLWVTEEMPGLILGHDQTSTLRRGYWPSYNVPFYKQVYNNSGYPPLAEKNGDYFTYELCPRAQIFRRDQATVVDLASLKTLMRYNNYKNDPYSFDGSSQNPYYAICSRGDLTASDPSPDGCYDTKVTSYTLGALGLHVHALNGPTTSGGELDEFAWAAFPNTSHVGLPPVYNFPFLPISPSQTPF